MRLRIFFLVMAASVPAMLVAGTPRLDAKAQVEFGINVAQKGLWEEAALRWQNAVKIDPTYAEAWNDLGVAYEQQGKFEEARTAYEKAIKLAPNNTMIRENYDLFREIYDRTHRKRVS